MIVEFAILVIALAAVLFLLWKKFQKSVSYYKETSEGRTTLHVSTRCEVKKVTVLAKESKGNVTEFVRTGISKGEEIEFIFPATKFHPKLIVECKDGTYEYEVE